MTTKEEVLQQAQEAGVKFVRLQFSDITGLGKNISLPVERLEEALDSGVQFDGSSIAGYTPIEESDMILMPDPDTFAVLPWTDNGEGPKAARLMCDVYNPDGTRFAGDPRGCLERMLDKVHDLGWEFNTGPECEFFLFETDDEGKPTVEPHDEGGYFDLTPMDHGESVRKRVVLYLESLGFDIEASHHEVAPGQHEIDFNYADALTTADRVMTLKYATKVVGLEEDLHATFVPKPIVAENGSGMHTHASLMGQDGEPIFHGPDGRWELSDKALHFLGGLIEYTPEITAVLNSTVNSYKRQVPGYEAPVYVSWANKNRSALVRVPTDRGKGTRLELRSPDPAGNPYLQFALILGAGLRGIEEEIEPPEPVERDIYAMSPAEREKHGITQLPENLGLALRKFKSSELARDVLGEHIHDQFCTVKQGEWDEYRQQVTDWEMDQYLHNY